MDLIIIGAGAFANTVADVARQLAKYEKICFLDDRKTGENILGKSSDFNKFIGSDVRFFPAIVNNEIRLDQFRKLESNSAEIATLIHPTAYISPTSIIGKGSIVLPKALVNTNCKIGNSCIINCGAIIDHDCVIEDGVHICLGAIVKGENRVGLCNKVEAGKIIQRGFF